MKHLSTFILCALLTLPAVAKELKKPTPIPDFTLTQVKDGSNIRLEELRGQVVMLNFWATWCGPCRQEMPYLEALYKKYKRAGFTILAINTEDGKNPSKHKEVKKFVENMKLSFPVLYDNNKEVVTAIEKKILKGDMKMPTTVVLDRNGKVRFQHIGYKAGDEKIHRKMAKALLRE